MKFLLDTNVVAELRKGTRANPGVRRWLAGVEPDQIALSVLTIGEIRRVIDSVRRRDKRSAAALERWLRRLMREHQDRILPADAPIAETWGRFNVPDPIPVIDGLLAATAQIQDLILVTRNVKDLARTGVSVLNPFEPE